MDESAKQLIHELHHASSQESFEILVEEPSRTQAHFPPPQPIPTPFAAQQLDHLNSMDAVRSSLLAGQFSDIIITHGANSWKAHKVVVCTQSAVLGAQIITLKNTSQLQLQGYSSEAFKLVMEYLYTATYTTSPSEPDFCLTLHLGVHDLATELQITGLQNLAIKFFTFNLSNYVKNLEVFFSTVQQVYGKTRSANFGLRFAVIEAAVSEMHTFLSHEEVWKRFVSLMAETPEFQKDMMHVMADLATDRGEVPPPVLCEACGPRGEGDCYSVQLRCKSCGADKTLKIL